MESSSSLSSTSSSSNRQWNIWSSRVRRELEKCRATHALPDGATLRRAQISESRGMCESEFHCFVPFIKGSDALALVPRIDLIVHMPFSEELLANGIVQYPFLAPEVEIHHGAIYLPVEMRERKVPKTEGEEPIFMLKMQLLAKWSPSTTLRMLVHEFFQQVQQLDPTPSKSPSVLKRESRQNNGYNKKPMKMRRRDVRGSVYPCQEVYFMTSTLKPTPMLLQSGNIALLVSSKHGKVEKDGDYVLIQDLISLKDVVRITPQRGKSLTLFFKERSLPCRTFLSPYTDDIIKDLRTMINDPRQRGRDEAIAESATRLLPFLSAEHTEKAKEMSNRLISKLGKVATSVSRFLRGDEDENMEQQEDSLAKVFAELNAQKEIFYRTPSKARMTEITRRYQHIAEEYTHSNDQEGRVERAISELQFLIEHPKAQRILTEAVAFEQSNKGIRVGPT